MHITTPDAPAHAITRFTLYRTLRLFTGPALAYRIAFSGRA